MADRYRTSDNRVFDSEFEARNHQDGLDRANAKTYYKTDDNKTWGSESDGQAWNCALAAKRYYDQKDWGGAIEMCNRGMAYNPNYGIMLSLYQWLGKAYFGKGDYDAAIDTFSVPLDKDPSNRMDWNNARHITDLDQRIAVVSLYFNRGAAYQNKGMGEEAIADYKTCIDFCDVYRDEYNLAKYRDVAKENLANLGVQYTTKDGSSTKDILAGKAAEIMAQGQAACREDNYAKAAELWTQAANMGHAESQYLLAGLYEEGKGIQKDVAKAAELYRMAADQGLDEAQHSLGFMYLTGEGIPQDFKQAEFWFKKAEKQGHNRSKEMLKLKGKWKKMYC